MGDENGAAVVGWAAGGVAGALVVLLLLRGVLSMVSARRRARQLADRAKRARDQRDRKHHQCLSSLPLPPKHLHTTLLEASVSELRGMMARKEVKCSEVLAIFISRARGIGRGVVNCVTEEMYDEAMARAREVDQLPQEAWEDKRLPLLGVPISIKDQFHQRGADSTCGISARCLRPHDRDGLLVGVLRDAGAIPFVRTNVPQLLMLPESENNIWGVSRNPYESNHTVGGSSGGEGGLIAALASPLGLGSDIGGSIRIPSHFNGVTGFKPTPARVSQKGAGVPCKDERNGQIVIQPTAGPMAKSVDDCVEVLRVLWDGGAMFRADATVPPLPFNHNVYAHGTGQRLRIGLVTTDHWFQPCAAVQRAVRAAGDALTQAGCEVVALDIPEAINGWEVVRLMFGVLGADGNMHTFTTGLEGEALYHSYRTLKSYTDVPNAVRPLIRSLLGLVGERRKQHAIGTARSGGLSTRTFWELCADLEQFRKQWMELLDQAKVDAVVLPGLALPAFAIGLAKELSAACSYTFVANLLHWPACAVPVTTVGADEQSYPMDRLPTDQQDSWAKVAAQSMQHSEGLPCGVQVLTRAFHDELCAHVARLLQHQLQPIPHPRVANVDAQ